MLYNHLKNPYRPWISPKNMSTKRAKCDDDGLSRVIEC